MLNTFYGLNNYDFLFYSLYESGKGGSELSGALTMAMKDVCIRSTNFQFRLNSFQF